MPKDQSLQSIQVITRAAEILRALARDTGGMSLGQIATQVNLPRSTVQRIVGALQLEGLVAVKKGAGGIGLGPEIQALAEATRSGMTGRMRRAMQAISTETGETVDLAVFEDGQLKFIDQIVGNHRLRTVSNVGEDFPLTTTANGKAAMAQLDQGDAAKLALAEFGKIKSSASLSKFLAELTKIENGALARDLNENTDGISALGFALKDDDGRIYALSVPVPSSRFARVQATLQTVLSNWRKRLEAEQATEG